MYFPPLDHPLCQHSHPLFSRARTEMCCIYCTKQKIYRCRFKGQLVFVLPCTVTVQVDAATPAALVRVHLYTPLSEISDS